MSIDVYGDLYDLSISRLLRVTDCAIGENFNFN